MADHRAKMAAGRSVCCSRRQTVHSGVPSCDAAKIIGKIIGLQRSSKRDVRKVGGEKISRGKKERERENRRNASRAEETSGGSAIGGGDSKAES